MVERGGSSRRSKHAYVSVDPALSRIDDFAAFVAAEANDEARWSELPRAEQIGRPVGAKAWIEDLEKQHVRTFSPARRGPKPRPAPSPEVSGTLFWRLISCHRDTKHHPPPKPETQTRVLVVLQIFVGAYV
jgi:hypothetical protein